MILTPSRIAYATALMFAASLLVAESSAQQITPAGPARDAVPPVPFERFPSAGNQTQPAIARGANRHLAVWRDTRAWRTFTVGWPTALTSDFD